MNKSPQQLPESSEESKRQDIHLTKQIVKNYVSQMKDQILNLNADIKD